MSKQLNWLSFSEESEDHLKYYVIDPSLPSLAHDCRGGDLVTFTSHNIRLDDGTCTKPEAGQSMDIHPWFLAAKRVLDAAFPGEKDHLSIADLGCLEGGVHR